MANAVKEHDARRPIGPDHQEWLPLRAMHVKLKRQIAERGMKAREIKYRRLQQLIAEARLHRR